MDKIKGLYTAVQLAEFEQIGQQMPPGAREEIERRWAALIAEVRASRHLDPASPEVQALADRWDALTEETMSWYQGHDELKAAIGEHYRQGHFEEVPEAPNQEDFTFIARVKQARTGGGVIGPASE